ncbi:MAG: molybdopterin-dependent oxidoreductase [Myxococcales bacterium]|nr:molybdopterin-dependent oxidoreductase [Myxococcales bacterium]
MSETNGTALTRRGFLVAGAAGVASLSLGLSLLQPRKAVAAAEAGLEIEYGRLGDIWRRSWTWDRVVHTSHARANCISACSWNVFVKNGIAWREEQNAVYEPVEEGVPDFNPRGCQKGACYTHLMYEPSRVLHPLRRVGERGSGRWKRVSWDDALGEIADAIIDASQSSGTGAVVYDHGTTNIDFGPDTAGEMRFFQQMNATIIDSWAGVGDMPYGAVQTWGMYNVEGTADDWFKSDFIVVWVGNPAYTRIPEVHFMHEARYRGAKLVVIAPDYSASAIHADRWLNPRVGTDAALALAMAQVILSEELHDAEYVREQTDLPILVREDTGRYLRESDLRKGGSDALLYFWDEAQDALAPVPGCEGDGGRLLALGALRPALAGRRSVRLADGSRAEVRPLLERLREHLDGSYTPAQVAEVTGVGAGTIAQTARDLAAAPTAMIYSSWGACKHYHSDLAQRAKILLMALTANQGKSGGGLRVASWWRVEGFEELSRGGTSIPLLTRLKAMWQGLTGQFSWREFEALMQEIVPARGNTPLMPFLYVHAGYDEIWDRSEWQDPAVPRSTAHYMKESIEKGWIPIRPDPGVDPKVFIFTGPNPLRRWPSPQTAKKHLWPKLDMIVDVNFKVGTSGMHSDVILPTSGYYERDSLKYSQAYLPYLLLCEKAVEPLGEAKPEWEIFGLMARKLQERARARGVDSVRDSVGGETDLSTAYDRWSDDGRFDERDPMAALDFLLKKTQSTGGLGVAEAKKTGMLPIVKSDGGPDPLYSVATDYQPGRTLYPHARFVEGKEVWPTFSGRQQFLIDHPWYEEVGETLPVYKEPPPAGGDYPLRLTGGHTRWSIHATWRDSPLMLRLQRGGPALWMSTRDADARGVRDGDRVRVFNDNGEFEAEVKLAAAVQPGQLVIYHAWEPYQFKGWRGQQEPVVAPWKALHLAGGYGQIHYRMIYGAPGHSPRGGTVEVERVGPAGGVA